MLKTSKILTVPKILNRSVYKKNDFYFQNPEPCYYFDESNVDIRNVRIKVVFLSLWML